MFLHQSSLTNSITMSVIMLLTKHTDVNAFDDGYEIVREHMETIVEKFIEVVELRAYTTERFHYVHNDTLSDMITDVVLHGLHNSSMIKGTIDIVNEVTIHSKAIAAMFEGDWNYRYFVNLKTTH